MTRPGLLTFGEGLAVFATASGKLRHATTVDVGIAGSEAIVAIGVARLGVPAAWAGRVGADEPGALVLSRLREDGVDTSAAMTDRRANTGLMLKDFRTADVLRTAFYRNGSAATRLCPEDIPEDRIRGAGVLHVTGLTAGLSGTAAKALFAAVDVARDEGVVVSFDINYRSAPWQFEDVADTLRDLVAESDIVFAGDDEARLLGFDGAPADLAAGLAGLGPDEVIVKLGPRGAVASLNGTHYDVPTFPVRTVDSEGSDDAFVAGYLAELLSGAAPERRLRTAAACRAFAASVPGERDGLPNREELKQLPRPHLASRA